MTFSDEDKERLSAAIADRLFVNGFGQQASRLILEGPNGGELGGWIKRAVAREIKAVLAADKLTEGK